MDNSEIEEMRAVWNLVAPEKTRHAVEIFIRLFEKHPETKAKFPRLNGCTTSAEVMRKSPRMRAHASRVAVSLGGILDQLEDMETMEETIFLLGDSHNKRGVVGEDFKHFAVVFVDYLKEALGKNFSSNAEDAFKKLLGIFNKKMVQHLDG